MKQLQFHFTPAVFLAIAAAFLFGASTPLSKYLIGDISPLLLAGLVYLGSGFGLTLIRLMRTKNCRIPVLKPFEWAWLSISILFGGMIAPVLFMLGLVYTDAAATSLLLNLEAVLTAILAWIIFKENTDKKIVIGMLFIVAGAVILSWPKANTIHGNIRGIFFITGACLCWAIDNNVTRKISNLDVFFVAGSKGFVAGLVNTGLAFLSGALLPHWTFAGVALLVGFAGYGMSLVLFILALRGLGTARTGAYFSVVPFIGAIISILLFHNQVTVELVISAVLMGMGVWIHLIENHQHEHIHHPFVHEHYHKHDLHHSHTHAFPWDITKSHSHTHEHELLTHTHAHYPDIHHRHVHHKIDDAT